MNALTGYRSLDRKLKRMRKTAAGRAVSAGLRKAGQDLAKKVKAEIPSRFKEARKGVGWRKVKRKVEVKVGARVGKRKNIKQKDRTGRKGVGLSAANLHWLLLGTKQRYTGRKGGPRRFTGRMAAQVKPVSVIAQKNSSTMRRLIKENTWKQIQKEVAKGKAY